MSFTILFVVALVLVSGFIAYFGDILGRRMGKKRLSLFGLRPKYTAIVVTTITGMIISTLALFTLIMVNSQFRRVFTQGEAIIRQSEHLTKANQELAKTGEELTAERDRIQGELQKVRAELTKVQAEIKRAEARVASARNEANAARKARDAAQRQVTKLREEISRIGIAVDHMRNVSALQTKRLAERKEALKEAQVRFAEAQQRLSVEQQKVVEAQRTLRENEVVIAAQLDKILSINKQFSMEFEEHSLVRMQLVAFRQGDEIARAVISTRQSKFAIRAGLMSLLGLASVNSERLDTAAGENGRHVKLIYRVSDPRDEKECLDTAQELIADSAMRGVSNVLVQILCARNSVEGEQVPVEMKFWRNDLAFSEGDLISLAVVDGKQSEGRILIWLNRFLQDPRGGVTGSALNKGIVPVANPSAVPQEQNYAQAQVDELLAIVDRIRAIAGPAKVEVVAARDIYKADALDINNIRFNITPYKSQ